MAVKPRSHGRKRTAAPSSAGRAGIQPSPVFLVTLGLLFLLPAFFTPGQLLEEFEFTKVSVLVTGALALAAWWIAAESSRIGAAGFAGWLRALPGRIVAAIRRDPLGGAVALMLLSAAASTIASIRPSLSLFGAPDSRAGLETIAGLAAIYFASRSLASDARWFLRLAQAAGAGAAVAAAYALLQIANLDPITWRIESSFEGMIRASGTIGHPNTLSAYLTMCLPLVVWLAARSRTRAAVVAWLALAGASLFVIVASLSRGAWLGVAAAASVGIFLALASGRRRSSGAVVAAVVVLAVAFLVPFVTPMRVPLLTRLEQLTDMSAATSRTRMELWRAGIRMFEDHPLLGVGVDAYLAAFPRYRTTTLTQIEWGGTPTKAHNDAIQILATQGSLGGLAALAIVILCARAVWRMARRANPELRTVAVAAGAALAGYVVPSLVGFGTVASSALAAALVGWAARAARMTDAHPAEGRARAEGDGRRAAGVPREGLPVRSAWNVATGIAFAGVLWYPLVGKPLRAEVYLARALRYPAGSAQRDDSLARAASTAPWDPRPFAELGRSLFYEALRERDSQMRLDLLARARGALTNAVRVAPENGENRLLHASVLSTQAVLNPRANSADEVREAFRRAVALDPLSPVVLVAATRGLVAAGLDQEARELALRCARAYPDYASPLADLGSIAVEQGRPAAAADTLKLALRRKWREDDSGEATAWNDLARASLALGRYQEAANAADSALAHNPGLGQAFANKEAAKRGLERKAGGRRGK